MFSEINSVLTELEKGCNIADSIPVVGILSSALRIKAGNVQFIAGAILFGGGILGVVIGNNTKHWNRVMLFGTQQALHGALNTIRALGTLLLAATGFNILLLAWQMIRAEGFTPVIAYNNGYDHRGIFAQAFW